MNKNKEIWIESTKYGRSHVMKIGSDWGCTRGFLKADYKKLYNVVSAAVKDLWPDVVINPWMDEEPGTPDID